MTVSGDLLFNLPGQSLSEMLSDISNADQIGLDQICLYHLVMFRGLATAWSRDPELIAALPGNEMAAANWEAIRTTAIETGDYRNELDVLAEMQLVEIGQTAIRLTVRGMFFADTIASVLAHSRHVRKLGPESAERMSTKGNESGHM